jgi:CelD/BcsL family acetyltransferase involved in cellulose biosynthesis
MIDGSPVAGLNAFAHGSTLVMTHSYRDRTYDRAGVGVHLDELIFRWAQASPYDVVDLGCGDGYKERWGAASGEATTFGIAPLRAEAMRRAAKLVRAVASGLRSDITARTNGAASNKNLTTPFRSKERSQDSSRARGQGALSAGDTDRSGVHT